MGPALVTACTVALVGAIGAVDYVTGTELRVYPLYFGPLALAARVGRRAVVFAALLSSVCWALANGLGQAEPGRFLYVNAVVQLGAFVFIGLLIHALRLRVAREASLARVDPLTQLWNKRAFHELVGAELGRSRRRERPLTIAYIDLDGFKLVNDQRGHDAGDAVLSEVAAVLTSTTRREDVVARLGGDEFALLLPDTDHAGAVVLLERVRGIVAARMAGLGHGVTASIGGVSFATPPADAPSAIGRADEAMYVAKRAGKNRVQLEPSS